MTPQLKRGLDYFGKRVNRALLKNLPGKNCDPKLAEAMRYSVEAGGKRVRPILTLMVNSIEGGDRKNALPPALALEYIHTYSLIHDDLPAMDDDDLRRGKPTSHKVFGEAMAILAGDGLLTLAFELLAKQSRPDQVRPLIAELAFSAGFAGMVGGQAADIQAEGKNASLDELKSIHARKTGALLTSAVMLGAISADVPKKRANRYREFGKRLGLTFQITDDILDCTSTAEQLGKTPGKDASQKKATYPNLLGLENARQKAFEAWQSAQNILEKMGLGSSVLADLNYYLFERVS